MWRFVSRSVYNKTLRIQKNALYNWPLINKSDRSIKSKQVLNRFLSPNVINFSKQNFGSRKEDKTGKENNYKYTKNNWHDAVGWTGVIAIGWIVCQTSCLNKIFHEFWNKSTSQIPININLIHLMNKINIFKRTEIVKIPQFKDLQNKKKLEHNFSKTFTSINHEEYDMLIHRQLF